MCGVSNNDKYLPFSEKDGESEEYVPKPFPEKQFEPLGWNDILATLDVCTNEVTLTMFCDEEGYDLFSFQMVRVLQHTKEGEKEETIKK